MVREGSGWQEVARIRSECEGAVGSIEILTEPRRLEVVEGSRRQLEPSVRCQSRGGSG